MLKKTLCLFAILSSSILTAIDSGTVSATLYFRLTESPPQREHALNLFQDLLERLQEEGVHPEVVNAAVESYELFVNGDDVSNDVKALYQTLTRLEADSEALQNGFAYDPIFMGDSREIKKNPLLNSSHYLAIKPWLIPKEHPMKGALDAIFSASRAIADKNAFELAGFSTFAVQPRSFIRVARHPELPEHVVKVYLDTELRKKKKIPGWRWFVKRCQGAKRIKEIIKKKRIQHFKVANKWIYLLPTTPQPIFNSQSDPKAEILIAQDMNLVSGSKSLGAWKTEMTKSHLDELYVIIAFAKGRSYRPDNIPYSTDGKFAFIDTEYPDERPDFHTPMRYLSPEMAVYWQHLIDKGGP